jgi:anion-transporting  ArsA/GET3 family ATPase
VSVPELLTGKRVCVVGGAGGVGKTTTSAAIALGMAAAGAKVAVVTIDPARRLANALGLEELANDPVRIDPARLSGHGLEIEGELWAMMLDPKRTFDELIERIAPSPERADEIKANGVYRELSGAVSGSQEFTAVAKLHELAREADFDLLVLDTPPSRNALDFFDAPGRLTGFLEGRALKAFLRPTGLGMRIIGRGASPLLGMIRRVTGVDLISDLTTFFGLLGDMTEDFSARAASVDALLHDPTTAFLVVTSPQPAPVQEAVWFARTLEESGLPFAGAIVNRVHQSVAGGRPPTGLRKRLREQYGASLAGRLVENLTDVERLATGDAEQIARLRGELGDVPMLLVPHLDGDVHDVDGLLAVHGHLFGADPALSSPAA